MINSVKLNKWRNQLKAAYKRMVFNMSANEHPLFVFYYKYPYSPKKGTLSSFLDAYSKAMRPITFLQIGANDGFNHDPLHKYIKRDRWRGLMLEPQPQPQVYENYLKQLHRKRPEIITLNAALGHQDGQMPLYKIAFSNERWATGLSTFDLPTLQEMVSSGAIAKKAKKFGVQPPTDESAYIDQIDIQVVSPATILQNFEKGFDLLMIDTEGYDFEIIKMLHIAHTKPDVIIYEECNFDEKTIQACLAHIETNGYAHKRLAGDRLCVKNDNAAILNLFKTLNE
jgi:FkbM family methyltransferase